MVLQSNSSISSYKVRISGFIDWNFVRSISESMAKKAIKERYCSVDGSKAIFTLAYLAGPCTVELSVYVLGKNTRKYCLKFF